MFIKKLKEKKLLFLSPHFDDIAISCGGLLHKISSNCNITILNVFSISNFAPYFPEMYDINAISEIREYEDHNFCESLNIEQINLGFKEAPLRGFSSLDEVFKGYDSQRDQTLVSQLKNIFKNHLSFDFIFVPIGFCSHVDHEIVKMAASVFDEAKIIYYEEQSYMGELEYKIYLEEIFRMQSYAPTIIEITSLMELKIAYAKIYSSQITGKEAANILTGAARSSTNTPYKYSERYWKSA